MTGPAQPASNVLQRARQRLLRLGLTDEHVLPLSVPASTSFDAVQLDPVNADPHFAPLVQRVLRFLRGGRGLSIAVVDDEPAGAARVNTAVQLASGLSRQGIQVVIADMDFQNPGLQGLIADEHAEGIIDMVRFGRSCRSVLQKPIEAGPALLGAGSFPVPGTAALDEDSVRSILHRVSLHCELALYVTPLRQDDTALNPVVRLCEHVVLVQSVSEQVVDIVEHIHLMQQARLHVAGVVLFDGTAAHQAPGVPLWQPGPFADTPPSPAQPGEPPSGGDETSFPSIGLSPPSGGTSVEPPAEEPPVQEPPGRAAARPDAAAAADSGAPPPAAPEPQASEPPAAPTPVMPHIPWAPPKQQSASDAETPEIGEIGGEEAIPEIRLPDEPSPRAPVPETRTVPATAPEPAPRPDWDEAGQAGPPTESVPPETSVQEPAARRGPEVIESLWSEPRRSEPRRSEPDDLEQESAGPADARRSAFEPADLEDAETEFAYDDGSNWSRTPLYILITLLVLIGGFFGWALWTKRGIEQQVGEKLSDTEWIDESQPGESTTVPDDAAAVPSDDAQLPGAALEELDDMDAVTPPPSQAPARSEAEESKPPEPTGPAVRPSDRPGAGGAAAGATTSEASGAEGSTEPPGGVDETPPESTPTKTTIPVGDLEYTVHVGSFRHLEQAYQDIATLQKHGFVGRAVKTDLGNKGIWYRVYVGGFPTRSEAEEVRDNILELPEYRYAQVKRIPR